MTPRPAPRAALLALWLALWPALFGTLLVWVALAPATPRRSRGLPLPEPVVDTILLLIAAWMTVQVLALLEAAWRAARGLDAAAGRLGRVLESRPAVRGSLLPPRSVAERLRAAQERR